MLLQTVLSIKIVENSFTMTDPGKVKFEIQGMILPPNDLCIVY